jgi:hypothetical protein
LSTVDPYRWLVHKNLLGSAVEPQPTVGWQFFAQSLCMPNPNILQPFPNQSHGTVLDFNVRITCILNKHIIFEKHIMMLHLCKLFLNTNYINAPLTSSRELKLKTPLDHCISTSNSSNFLSPYFQVGFVES